MNYHYKMFLQSVFSLLPRGERINYFFQRYITQSIPVSDERFINKVCIAHEFYKKIQSIYNIDSLQNYTYYEFGAGWDLVQPLALSLQGLGSIYSTDIKILITSFLLNNTLEKFQQLRSQIPFSYPNLETLSSNDNASIIKSLKDSFGITYQAPIDSRHTPFQNHSIDIIGSNSTLEHIPKEYIPAIFADCYRILKPGGIISCRINYNDHYSIFDNTISQYNFLRYSESQWRLRNPALHYQNRLRHSDFLTMITDAGFNILENKPSLPTEEMISILRKEPVHERFKKQYSEQDLAITDSWIIAVKEKV